MDFAAQQPRSVRDSREDGDNRPPRRGSPISDARRPPGKESERPAKRSRRDSRTRDEDNFHSGTTRPRSPGRMKESKRSEARRDARREDDGREDRRTSPLSRSNRGSRESRSYSASRSPPRRRRSRSPRTKKTSRRTPSRSRSPPRRMRRSSYSRSRSPPLRKSRQPLPSQEESYRGGPGEEQQIDALDKPIEKEKPNFKPSGLLAAETNKVTIGSGSSAQNIVLKYHEPSEARKPPSSERWVLYVFKGKDKDPLQTIPLYTRSCWLLGRETAVADIPIDHPSCSKQHAVFQFRYTVKKNEWGEKTGKVGLYVLDLESSNGTTLNGNKIDAARYVECLTGDVVQFGDNMDYEYVLLLPPKGEK